MSEHISENPEAGAMSIMAHLEELRNRLIRVALALTLTTAGSFVFVERIIEMLKRPMGDALLVFLKPTDSIANFMKVSLISGVTLAMPVIVYQFFRFIVPGLTRQERRYLLVIVPGATLSFLAGVAFAYFLMLPAAVKFLYSFLQEVAQPFWSLDTYLSMVTRLIFWVGMAFETPLIVFFLAKMGVISTEMLTRNRKYAMVVVAVLAAVITPTPDPVNMGLVMLPLILLYEIGILLSRLA
ncbi:MAG: twin-arginine translocase subunit TatC [Chloroflexota bacterium]